MTRTTRERTPGTVEPREYPPIADYGLISDCHGAALLSRDGSIDWCSFHRADASPVFGRILDWEKGGHWQVAPTDVDRVDRRYVPGTNILETRFDTSSATITLTDCMVVPKDGAHPPHQLVRLLRCERGRADLVMHFEPRFDYGLTVPRYHPQDEATGVVLGGADGLVLESSVPLEPVGTCTARAVATLSPGDEEYFVLTYHTPHELEVERLGLEHVRDAVAHTEAFWCEWSGRCRYDGEYRDHVVRSALVLKALTNMPTGAIVAAPTTSLPEEVGGVRNWDYRYAWLRDAALNLYSLFGLGYTEEAHAFMAWVERTTAGLAEQLQVLYGVGGERLVPEVELDHLDGYRGSRPVRTGNAASQQFQLDVYGYLLDTGWLYHRHGGEISETFWSFLRDVVDHVGEQWTRADEGIWEVRGGPRQFVSSKVLAWVAVDRGLRLADALGFEADLNAWRRLREEIRTCVERDGIDERTGAFVQELGGRSLDASALLLPLVRFLPADDERVVATMDRIRDELTEHGLVYRYIDADDGVPGGEATFAICSFWLVDNLALAGRVDEAKELFERVLTFVNDLGLLSEQIDPVSRELLGNFPQAFSHVGLIGAARNLARADRRRKRRSRR